MKNSTGRLRQSWSIAGLRSFVVAVFLIVGISPGLATAATLGPADGDGLVPTDLERVKVGEAAPDFTLEDENGKLVTLSQLRDKNSVILVFYRGHW